MRVPANSPAYTALAVKALVLSGMVTREELEASVTAYAAQKRNTPPR